jgi:hypothetical protein
MADQWRDLDQAFAELEAECEDVVRGLTVRVFNGTLSKTPQFLGRMTASWNYCLGTPEYSDRSNMVDPLSEKLNSRVYSDFGTFKGLYRGHPLAIAIANQANKGKDRAFKLGMTVYLTNGVDHGEGGYASGIEDGSIKLRAVNRPGAPASRTLDWAGTYYRTITKAKASSLKALSIGQSNASSDS